MDREMDSAVERQKPTKNEPRLTRVQKTCLSPMPAAVTPGKKSARLTVAAT